MAASAHRTASTHTVPDREDASTHTCAACERVVTGTGYGCVKCGFHIHKACFAMPVSVSFAQHSREHELRLTRLTSSRWCDVCKVTSHAGSYMYHCAPCNYDLHPRCVPTKTPAPNNNMGRGAGSSTVLTSVQVASRLARTGESVCTMVEKVNRMVSNDDDDEDDCCSIQ